MKLKVVLNGTNTNPWHKLRLTQNPFPQIAKAEYASRCMILQKLGGDPIPDTGYIREVLTGWSDEFVDLCCKMFQPGRAVVFTAEFSEQKAGGAYEPLFQGTLAEYHQERLERENAENEVQ